ncbi:MAG: hypothetical protein M3R69_16020, partial [Acidobacteriota bacterium]|nr:hypothetical protein [Acidobacteriota bacterium]
MLAAFAFLLGPFYWDRGRLARNERLGANGLVSSKLDASVLGWRARRPRSQQKFDPWSTAPGPLPTAHRPLLQS